MTVTVHSFAKINLGLYIGAPRADGFHELLTVYQTIGLHDVIRVSAVRSGGRASGIEIRCADPRVPRDESNTCFRIVEKAMAALGAKAKVIIEIEKRLPVQGGLGGASANAVATLVGLERALKKSLPVAEKLRIAAEVGSDLPLFLVGGTVLGVGRGEQVYPLPDLPPMACVIVTPEVGVSTPKAFAEWDRMQGLKPPSSLEGDDAAPSTRSARSSTVAAAVQEVPGTKPAELRSAGRTNASVPTRALAAGLRPARPGQRPGPTQTAEKLTVSGSFDRINELGRELSAWLSGEFQSHSGAPSRRGRAENPLLELVRAGIKNDFESVVFPEYPELGEVKRALERAGAKYASLSGSGSALYGLFALRMEAERAAEKLRKRGWAARATATLMREQYWSRIFS